MNVENKNPVTIQYNEESYIKYDEYKDWINMYNSLKEDYKEQSDELKKLKDLNKEDASLKVLCILFTFVLIYYLFTLNNYFLGITASVISAVVIFSLVKVNKDFFA